jgi:cytochrome b561
VRSQDLHHTSGTLSFFHQARNAAFFPAAAGHDRHMQIRDTTAGYGLLTRLLHWGMAVAIIALFALGLWMVTLTYYSPYYTLAPDVHRSVGMLLLFLLVFRFGWRLANAKPDDPELKPYERVGAAIVHWGFYPLLFALMVSGYLISTADGRPIAVFDWFSVPAVVTDKGLEEPAGKVHEILAYLTMALIAVHAAASLKHHFIDRSRILTRMWSGPSSK